MNVIDGIIESKYPNKKDIPAELRNWRERLAENAEKLKKDENQLEAEFDALDSKSDESGGKL